MKVLDPLALIQWMKKQITVDLKCVSPAWSESYSKHRAQLSSEECCAPAPSICRRVTGPLQALLLSTVAGLSPQRSICTNLLSPQQYCVS